MLKISPNRPITSEELKRRFIYENGKFKYKEKPYYTTKSEPGCFIQPWNRWVIQIDNIPFRYHYLIWIYHNDSIPDNMKVCFKDENPHNLAIENLYLKKKKKSWVEEYNMNRDKSDLNTYINSLPDSLLRDSVFNKISMRFRKIAENLREFDENLVFKKCQDIAFEKNLISEKVYLELTTGLPIGVRKARNRYRADIMENKKSIYLGTFNTSEEASQAYLKAKGNKDYRNRSILDEFNDHTSPKAE